MLLRAEWGIFGILEFVGGNVESVNYMIPGA